MRYGIIADDLTGSCDVAGRLTLLGYRPVVYVRPLKDAIQIRRSQGGSDVVIVNIRSREGSAREAKSRVRAAARILERSKFPVVYHKLDSTLRGHWAEELQALAGVVHPDYVLVCPAFPAQGRRIEHGKLLLDGEARLGLLAFFDGPEEAWLSERLRESCRWEAVEIPRKTLRRGVSAVHKALDAGGEPRCGVFDAYHDNDLAAIGRVCQRLTGRILCVGSAGLAPHVLPRRASPELVDHSRPPHPWLLIQGSRRRVSHEQFRRLAAVRDLHLMALPPWEGRGKRHAWCDEAVAALTLGRDVAIGLPEGYDTAAARSTMSIFERLFRNVFHNATLGGVFVSGGATAEAVCDSLRVSALRVTGEAAPGIPVSIALDGRLRGLHFITKAGGFGGPDTVREILEEFIRARR